MRFVLSVFFIGLLILLSFILSDEVKATEENTTDKYSIFDELFQSEESQKELKAMLERAKQGNSEEQVNMGVTYHTGNGFPQDYDQAFFWYKKAAEQGYSAAQKEYKELKAKLDNQ